MRILLQRAARASVAVDGTTKGEIDGGLVALVAAGEGDERGDLEYCLDKTVNLRIFRDEEGKMNRSLRDVGGSILAIPQFTLYGDVSSGRRPSFFDAMDPGPAEELYENYLERLREFDELAAVESGVFGEMMAVELVNDGPVTIWIDSRAD